MPELLALASIRRDLGTQPRIALHLPAVASYREAYERGEGDKFPPLTVFYDGTNYILADGFHRAEMYQEIGVERVPCDVHQGSLREAVLYSLGANSRHGLPRTSADKRQAVIRMLQDEEWSQWSDREIARRCVVSPGFVGQVRGEYSHTVHGEQYGNQSRSFTHPKTGEKTTMSTGGIGRMPPPKVEKDRTAGKRAAASTLEPDDGPEYDDSSRFTPTSTVIEPKSAPVNAEPWHRLWQVMMCLPERPAELLPAVPADVSADEIYRWSEFLGDLGELIEARPATGG